MGANVWHLGGDESTPSIDPAKEGFPAGQGVGGIDDLVPTGRAGGALHRRGRGRDAAVGRRGPDVDLWFGPACGATAAATTNPLARRCGRLERFARLPSAMTISCAPAVEWVATRQTAQSSSACATLTAVRAPPADTTKTGRSTQ